MSSKKQKRQLLKKKLYTKNRLVIQNEETFEEVFSLRLTLMNIFVFASLGAIVIITLTTFIIAFTPLREFIPGYSSSKLRKDATELALKSDSLSKALEKNDRYLKSIIKVLNGDLEYQKVNKDSILDAEIPVIDEESMLPSKEEIELRKAVEEEEKKNKKN